MRIISGNWPIGDIFNLDKIKDLSLSTDNSIDLGENLRLEYNAEFMRLSVYKKDYPSGVITFWLNEDQNIKEIRRYDVADEYAGTIYMLDELRNLGVLKNDIFAILGIHPETVSDMRKRAENEIKIIEKINEMNKKLPGIEGLNSIFYAVNTSPYVVVQGEAAILRVDNKKYSSLYTFGAGPCLILALIGKNRDGEVKVIGLAHIDAAFTERDFNGLLIGFKYQDPAVETIEIYIISGEKILTTKVLMSLESLGYLNNIKCFDVDLEGNRSDALCIDVKGNIYYGNNSSWNSMARDSGPRFPGSGIQITRLEDHQEGQDKKQKIPY